MDISKRTEPYLRETPAGAVLVATRLAGQPPQFPPVAFLHGEQCAQTLELGPLGKLYSYSIVHVKDRPPYGLAMVDFADQDVRAFGRLLFDEQPPAIGTALRVVPFTLPDGTPDYAFQE